MSKPSVKNTKEKMRNLYTSQLHHPHFIIVTVWDLFWYQNTLYPLNVRMFLFVSIQK